MAVRDYNTDPNLNTKISGINIAEGCPPSGINNAIRQLMADVKQNADEQSTKFSKVMTGATSSKAGVAGLVPAPGAGRQSAFLTGAGTWADPFFIRATNPVSSVANDTISLWSGLGSGVFFFTKNGLLANQPSQYGFLLNYTSGGDIFQIWKSQSDGSTYVRSGNADVGWAKPFSMLVENSDLQFYVSQSLAAYMPKSGGTMTGGLNMNGNTISNVQSLNGMTLYSGGYNGSAGKVLQPVMAYLEGKRRYLLKTATGLLMDSGTVAVKINTQATVSFYSPFMATPFVFYSITGRTGGYNPYLVTVSSTGFSLGWETFGSSQNGAAATLHYLAVGPEQTL